MFQAFSETSAPIVRISGRLRPERLGRIAVDRKNGRFGVLMRHPFSNLKSTYRNLNRLERFRFHAVVIELASRRHGTNRDRACSKISQERGGLNAVSLPDYGPTPSLQNKTTTLTKRRDREVELTEKDPFVDGVLECLPHLRGFAHLLARDHAHAEDLVQETVLRAISHRHQFQPGTSLRRWLIVILRNRYFSDRRRNVHRATVPLDANVNEPFGSGGQEETVQFKDFERQFRKLPDAHREALLLVGVNGFSYEEAAQITGRAIGTIKSRVSRARQLLQDAMEE